jgi:hypothetical protein
MVKIRVPSNMGGGEDPVIEIKDSAGIKSGKYSKTRIEKLVKAANAIGVDPHHLIALSLQESGIGTAKPKRSQVSGRHSRSSAENFLGQVVDFDPRQEEEMNKLSAATGIEAAYLKPAIVLRDKLKYAQALGFKGEEMQLQAYNGYGKLLPQKDASGKSVKTRYYGMDIPEAGIDMRANPLYGKRLVQLKKDLIANKDIAAMINPKPL